MTYYADLTSYEYQPELARPRMWNVGWLDGVHPYPQGPLPAEFVAWLWAFCRSPLYVTRGWHECELCATPVDGLFWVGLGFGVFFVLLVLFLVALYVYLRVRYAQYLVRIFQETPLFIIPRGQPVPGAEDVTFPSVDGLKLRGCYLRTSAPRRRGVILFGLEFGSNRWASVPYCETLLAQGFDVFGCLRVVAR